jgi:HlyD family secretion protein
MNDIKRQITPFRLRRRVPVRVLLATLAVGAVGLAGCNRGGSAAAAKATQVAIQNPGTQVVVTPARVGSISDIAQVTGALNALHDVTVGVKAAGKVVAVYNREGDFVHSGQVVAQQDPADLQAQLDQQRANLVSAQTKLAQARVTYQNAVTTQQWTDEQTRSAVRQAQAGLSASQDQAAVVEQGARPQEIQQSKENVAAAKADLDKARADLKRYQDLYRQQAVSAQQLDQAQSIADSADARYNAAVQALSLQQEGNRPEDIRRSKSAVEQARQELITAQANRSQVILRHQDVENARVGILAAQAGVRQAQAAVRLAEQALADAIVRSPISGVVAERKVEPGMQLGAGKDVMRIVALDSIYFDAQLSETQYAEVHVGLPVAVTVDALPGRTFRGSITKIYPVASTTARSFSVRISLVNEGNTLRPQMFARGQITLATHPHAVLVSSDAVLDNNGSSGRVFSAQNGVAKERPVKLGFSYLRDIEIVSGVQAGDKIITVGQAQLQDGDKIQIISGNEPSAPAASSTALR